MTQNQTDSIDRNQAMVTTVLQLSMARSIEEVGEVVRRAARTLTGAQGATFILREGDECYYVDEDAIAPLWKGKRFRMDACISGWTMLHKTSAIVSDIYADNRIPHEAYRPTFVKSLVMVPIRRDNPLGAIGNYWSSANSASEETLKVLQALADITAVSIENIYAKRDLEKRVQERTAQLEQTNEQLRSLNNELQTITYALSHDLKAPLRSIGINFERMMDELNPSLTDKSKNYRDRVLSKVGGAQKLIDELLTLFQTGNKELVMEKVEMKSLAAEAVDSMSENRNVSIDDLPSIAGDKVLLKHVWTNLVSNAIKYSSRVKDAHINIGFQEKERSIVYCIEDNGVGFNMEIAKDLFKPFKRFHSTEEYEGAGIGLSIVERIVTRHKGKVWARSAVGKGTTVFFELPRQ